MSEQKESESIKDLVAKLYTFLKVAKKEEAEGMLVQVKDSCSLIQDRLAKLKLYFSLGLDTNYIDEMITLTTNLNYLCKFEKDVEKKLQEFA